VLGALVLEHLIHPPPLRVSDGGKPLEILQSIYPPPNLGSCYLIRIELFALFFAVF
jgi:hypothetical protein